MSHAAFEMDEQLKEIALRVASEMPCLMNHVSIADGVNWTASELLEFAARFLAALPKPEPVGLCDTENRIRWGGNDSSHRYSSAPNWLRVGTHIYTEAPPIQSAQAEIERLMVMSATEAAATIPSVGEYIAQIEQQLAAAQLHIEQLRGAMLMMLCDSEGKCFMAGSVKDRFIIDTALSTQPDRSALEAERQRVAEACAAMLENGSFLHPESQVALAANGAAKAIRAGQWKDHMK